MRRSVRLAPLTRFPVGCEVTGTCPEPQRPEEPEVQPLTCPVPTGSYAAATSPIELPEYGGYYGRAIPSALKLERAAFALVCLAGGPNMITPDNAAHILAISSMETDNTWEVQRFGPDGRDLSDAPDCAVQRCAVEPARLAQLRTQIGTSAIVWLQQQGLLSGTMTWTNKAKNPFKLYGNLVAEYAMETNNAKLLRTLAIGPTMVNVNVPACGFVVESLSELNDDAVLMARFKESYFMQDADIMSRHRCESGALCYLTPTCGDAPPDIGTKQFLNRHTGSTARTNVVYPTGWGAHQGTPFETMLARCRASVQSAIARCPTSL